MDIDSDQKISAFKDKTDEVDMVKSLGLKWFLKDDVYKFNLKDITEITFTKRGLLSLVSTLYDPLGWHLPVTMELRMKMQELWRLEYDWDDSIDEKSKNRFEKSISALKYLKQMSIERWIGTAHESEIELIGFADASGDGFAAVIYARVQQEGCFKITLVQARGRVTPLKSLANKENTNNTIPKMELQALTLLAELFTEVMKSFQGARIKTVAYSDNQAVIQWVRHNNARVKFIKKRITKIRKAIQPHQLHYVTSAENPADIPSRGTTADILVHNELWLKGPHWMTLPELPTTPFNEPQPAQVFFTNVENLELTFLNNFSNFRTLINSVALVLRWKPKGKDGPIKKGPLLAEEVTNARHRLIRWYQQATFSSEITNLEQNKQVSTRSSLAPLCPFLDANHLLRVGGRLRNALTLNFDQKHPIILKKGHLVRLIIRDIHWKNGHGGNRLVERTLREQYWVPTIKNEIKGIIRACTVCIRWNAMTQQPIMGQLPIERVEPAPAFSSVGVDLAGPFAVKPSHLKFDRAVKAWICVFVCLITKAVHLEYLADLTTDEFLAAFSRMTSRRGMPNRLLSDNGTNFVGANRKLQEAWTKISSCAKNKLAFQEVTWEFIPVQSPWFGGIWESAVKSIKFLMKRMANLDRLTLGEFNTLLCKIEGILNSRPLYPNTNDVDDLPALTPFQLCQLRSQKNNPADVANLDKTLGNKRMMQIRRITVEFWERFQFEYLNQMQKMNKWVKKGENLKINDVVLLKDVSKIPKLWKMAKVTEVFPDKQGVVRQVTVITQDKEKTNQSAAKCVLLIKEEQQREEPVLRRSQRRTKKASCLITMALLTWLTVADAVTHLTPGLTIHNLRDVSTKAMNFQFTVTSNINVTQDRLLIQEKLANLETICKKYAQHPLHNALHPHCIGLQQTVSSQAKLTLKEIQKILPLTNQQSKEKRWVAIAKTLGKATYKYGSEIAMTAGLIYQEHKISELEAEAKDLKIATRAMLNYTDAQYNAVNKDLQMVMDEQAKTYMETILTEYTTEILALLTTIAHRYQSLHENSPVMTLLSYMRENGEDFKNVKLPPVNKPEDWFTLGPRQVQQVEDIVQTTYSIPLVSTTRYTEYVLVSIPASNKPMVLFSQQTDYVSVIVSDEKNITFYDPKKAREVYPNVFEVESMETATSCEALLIRHMDVTTDACQKTIGKQQLFPRVLHLSNHQALVISTKGSNITVTCSESKVEGTFMIVNLQDCSIDMERQYIESRQEGSTTKLFDEIVSTDTDQFELEESHIHIPDKQLAELKTKILDLTEGEKHYPYFIGGGLTMMCGVTILFVWLKKRKTEARTPRSVYWIKSTYISEDELQTASI
jgi:DNA-binding transcriptional MerR regulator